MLAKSEWIGWKPKDVFLGEVDTLVKRKYESATYNQKR